MNIRSEITWGGRTFEIDYKDIDSFEDIKQFTQVYGVCFVADKIVICYNKKDHWVLPGGTPEHGEGIEETLRREIMEEAGLELISYLPIGYQEARCKDELKIQLRAVCRCKIVAKPNDPCHDITKIKLIDIKDIKQYIDWGKIGDRVFQRAEKINKLL